MISTNEVYTHPGQPQMQVEVILASAPRINTGANPIYTIRMRYPRCIHGEIMTHRDFGRNARSSRAVPVETMLNEVRNNPYMPWHWGKNQAGMQADEECNELVHIDHCDSFMDTDNLTREQAWLHLAGLAVDGARAFMEADYHKQIANRLLEPFSWIDTLITSTEWDNFLWLRQHKDAEPHLQDLANLVALAIEEANLQPIGYSDWHLPYITDEDRNYASERSENDANQFLLKLSAARCARISYKPFDGDASYEKEIARYNLLVGSDRVHASPLEHQAMPDYKINSQGREVWKRPRLHGNLNGYVQARKLVDNECYWRSTP